MVSYMCISAVLVCLGNPQPSMARKIDVNEKDEIVALISQIHENDDILHDGMNPSVRKLIKRNDRD